MKKKILVIGTAAAATVLAGGLAVAHSFGHGRGGYGPGFGSGGCPGMGMHGQMGPGMQGQYGPGMYGQRGPRAHGGPRFAMIDPAQFDKLKADLGIKAEQEPAWSNYTKTVQDAATAMKSVRADFTKDADKARQERFAARTKMREEAQKQFKTVKTAADDLLAKLDDAQKAKAQQALPGLAFGPGMARAGGPGWHHPRW
jgi:hypothetical protein